MSHFYGEMIGSRNKIITRCGHATTGMRAHLREWNVGVEIFLRVNEHGQDEISVYKTSGSNGSDKKLIKKFSK